MFTWYLSKFSVDLLRYISDSDVVVEDDDDNDAKKKPTQSQASVDVSAQCTDKREEVGAIDHIKGNSK